MKTKSITSTVMMLLATAIGTSSALAAKQKQKTADVPLTATGQKLETQYAEQLVALKAEISKALPAVNNEQKAAFLKAREAEVAAEADAIATQAALEKSRDRGLLNHRKAWIGRAIKGVAEAKEKLKQAEAMTGDKQQKAKAVKEAQKALAEIQENYDMAATELKKCQDEAAKAELEEPKLVQRLDAAKKELARAKAKAVKSVNELNLETFLKSDMLDSRLAKYQTLSGATPRGLAEFAQQGQAQEALIQKLFVDAKLITQMAVAGGAKSGKVGQAMKIYSDIQMASKKTASGVLQRLALAVSLEHAVPIAQRNATDLANAPATVNPVNRYLHFENAFLNNELDPAFKDLSVWDYRMVVNGNEPDEILTWGRQMLQNYRPDHISTPDYRWRYVAAVRTDIKYGSQDNKCDKSDQQFFQNILMNGGICGRRAFFGRFILRSFGIPTVARPQRGHAALAHWTPDGWVVCLGGGWGAGWASGPEAVGRDRTTDTIFLAQTQARMTGKPFEQVWRANAVGTVLGQEQDSGFFNGVATYQQRAIIEEAQSQTLAAVGEDIGEANESKVKEKVSAATITKADTKIVVSNGVITIPAAACSKPTNSTSKIKFMQSNLGGMQLHYNRTGGHQDFEYTFDAPAAGKYALTARVVTPSWKQHLMLTVNDAAKRIDIELPYTVGMWDETNPVGIDLVKGKNVLRFSREGDVKGITIKDFTLTPVSGQLSLAPAHR